MFGRVTITLGIGPHSSSLLTSQRLLERFFYFKNHTDVITLHHCELICMERGENYLHMVQLMPLPPHHLLFQ